MSCNFTFYKSLKSCAQKPTVRASLPVSRATAVTQEYVTATAEEDTAQLRPVENVVSARVVFDDEGGAIVQYLAKWKDDSSMTWEPTENLSEDLVRDFEEAFWQACKMGDMTFLTDALKYGGQTVANIVNSEGRSAIHLASALNHCTAIKALVEAGADVNVQDPEGYTPLHMAAGYLHVEAANELLKAGADITQTDKGGRDVKKLIDSIRDKIVSASAIQQRMRLEQVAKALTYHLYEDVAPAAVLRMRKPAIGEDGPPMYLVRWRDGQEDSWLPADFLSLEVREDFEAGLEYAEAEEILDRREVDCAREYLVRWSDTSEPSWESEDNLSRGLVEKYEADIASADNAEVSDAPAPAPQPV